MGGSDNKPNNDLQLAGEEKPNLIFLVIAVMIPLCIGTALAAAIYYFDGSKTKYDEKMGQLETDDIFWIYIALVVLGRCISYINFYPASFKKHMKGNIRSNPFFYQTEKVANESFSKRRVHLASIIVQIGQFII